ncbi:MAG: Flagellar biosynthetic protein FliQ [bacterium ADurb.Bin157]|jgi:flagellar biosynthesis protein FliQ|nr:flagellar biosynthesis protein FliQ [Candidatus Riflebacteria bacterium]MDD2624083.1 flagellar biosynthesis protein FliQ [Candidatus Riflebacteria bacterium]NCB46505.1 flagellar biosynthetic protein FliQ [bacterium]NLV95140.1 flagellar biosynthesis protein FliQ [Candidatus Riflebacteria bacterium]OQB44046.1 MAG: Flagellar biosynthetic protein FliQ [bacterium ADurb.Bin157]
MIDANTVVMLFSDTFMLTLKLSVPILTLGMVIGIIVSIFQTATSIQEQTLTFIPKLIITALALIGLSPWMLQQIMTFTINLMGRLQDYAR